MTESTKDAYRAIAAAAERLRGRGGRARRLARILDTWAYGLAVGVLTDPATYRRAVDVREAEGWQ